MNKLKKIHFFGGIKDLLFGISNIQKCSCNSPKSIPTLILVLMIMLLKFQNEKDQYSRTKDIAQHHCNYRRITTPPTFLPF